MFPSFFFSLADHLWQSTVFALAAALLTLALRKNHARTRFWIWWAASVKFLIPFSLLVSLGSSWSWPVAQPSDTAPSSLLVIEQFAQPFAVESFAAAPIAATSTVPRSAPASVWPALLVIFWLTGSLLLLVRWSIRWNRVRHLTKNALRSDELAGSREVDVLRRLEHQEGIPPLSILTSRSAIEPSVFGFFRHVLVWPAGLSSRLEDGELEAVLLHELAHARRRDNITSGIHLIVESLFWFHPLVWWIGARLVAEREKACDETVLRRARVPQDYAAGILKVCEFCLESPLLCASGITGADLKRRIEDIMKNRSARRLSFARRVLLVTAGLTALSIPLVAGSIRSRQFEVELLSQVESRLKTLTHVLPARVEPAPPTALAAVQLQPVIVRPVALPPVQPQKDVFDALSIRPAQPGAAGGPGGRGGGGGQRGGGGGPAGPCTGSIQLTPGRMTIRNMTTYRLVTAAYGVDCRLATELKLVLGDAEWVSTAAYDVEGTFPSDFPTYTVEQFNNGEAPRLQAMLRDVLAERFGLALHRETKEIPMYNLVMVKPGRIRLSADQTPPPPLVLPTGPPPPGTPPPEMPRGGYQLGINPAGGQVMLEANSIPIRTVIGFMRNTGRMIVDKVEPRGLYDIPAVTLDVGPFSAAPGAVTVWPEIAQQLGLRLEPTKGPFETIVIDRVQKPSEN